MPGDIYAFLRPSATCYLSGLAMCRMMHSCHISLALRCCQLLQYSLHLRYIVAVAFALPLSYFTGLENSVQSLHSLVLCPESSTFWVDPSSGCNASSLWSESAFSPLTPSYLSTLLFRRSILFSVHVARHHRLAVGMVSRMSLSSPSSLLSLLPPGIPICSSSSVQLLAIWMFGSVLAIPGSSTATSEVK